MELSKQIKIIFLDCDHTAFDHIHFEVRPLTIYALRRLKEKGYIICISTSRSYDEMRKIDKEFMDLADCISTLAGAHIIFKNETKSYPIDSNEVNKLVDYFDNKHIPYRYATNDGLGYLSETNDYIDNLFYEYYHMIPEVKKYSNEEVLQIMYYTFDTNVHKEVKELVPDLVVNNMALNSEISSNNVDKGQVMEYICNKFNLSVNQAMAFGDSENDNTMLSNAYFGVCVGNGRDETKAIADYVCENQQDDGIYKTFVKYGFIEPYIEEDKELFNSIINACDVDANTRKNITNISKLFVETIKNGGVIQMLGIGKLEEFAQELYYRAGGLVAFHKMSTSEFNDIEEIDSVYQLDDRDAYLLISEDGKEEIINKLVKRIKNNKQKLVLALRKSNSELEKQADYILKLNDMDGPIKITCDNVLAQLLSFETYDLLKKDGFNPPIFMSNNNPDASEHNKSVLLPYGKRVHE